MPISPWQSLNPDQGAYYLIFERRFRIVVEDPERTWRLVWIPTVIACPVCEADNGLRLAYTTGLDAVVEAACPVGHIWVEPRIDVGQWKAYCRYRTGMLEADWLWLIEAGFGEEPPPPIDYAEDIRQGAVAFAKVARRRAKATARREVRKVKKKVAKRARNEVMRPVAAFLRVTWTMQAGGAVQKGGSPRRRAAEPKPPKTPPLSAYRKAYGMETPEKGPKCLVCEDSGRITAPGVSIPCTECAGPVAAVLEEAERRVERVRQGKEDRSPHKGRRPERPGQASSSPVTGSVVVVNGSNEQVIATRSAPGRPLSDQDAKLARAVEEAAEGAIKAAGDGHGVHVHGRNNSVITHVTGADR
ncbi:hypothetical protein [Streptomyces sp. DT195]|uniref:hypothetical protein n=1 Tax=Streptomyces sp. DT195 TaxID=3393419 RepID=UPI003CF56784